MKYQSKKELISSFWKIINEFILNENKTNDINYNKEKVDDLKELMGLDKETNKSNFEDLIMFMETAFNLNNMEDDEYISLFTKIKEVELSFLANEIIDAKNEFKVLDEFVCGDLTMLKENTVFYYNDELRVLTKPIKKTSKGYQILSKLVFSDPNINFVSASYLDLNDKSFYIIGDFL